MDNVLFVKFPDFILKPKIYKWIVCPSHQIKGAGNKQQVNNEDIHRSGKNIYHVNIAQVFFVGSYCPRKKVGGADYSDNKYQCELDVEKRHPIAINGGVAYKKPFGEQKCIADGFNPEKNPANKYHEHSVEVLNGCPNLAQ